MKRFNSMIGAGTSTISMPKSGKTMDSFRRYFEMGKADALAGKPCESGLESHADEIYRMGYDEGLGEFKKIEIEKSRKQGRLF